MEEQLEKLYYDPKTGYGSLNKLIETVKEKKLKIPKAKIKKWFQSQEVNQIYKKSNQKKKYSRIWCPYNAPGCFQMDLQQFTKFNKNKNKGYQYALNIIDIYSRFVYSYPIKKKSPNEIIQHIEHWHKDFKKNYPHNIVSMTNDDGKEFKGTVQKFFNDKKIKVFIANPKDNTKLRTMIIERYHRTYWDKLKKVLTYNSSDKWIDYHQDIILNYNKSLHSYIGQKPYNVYIKKMPRNLKPPNEKQITNKLKIGDNVRYLKNKKVFSKKSFVPIWSIKVYTIKDIQGKKYILSDNGTTKRGSYLLRELQKVKVSIKGLKFKEIQKETDTNKKIVRKLRKNKLGDVDEDKLKIKINKRLKPKYKKRKDPRNDVTDDFVILLDEIDPNDIKRKKKKRNVSDKTKLIGVTPIKKRKRKK
jgi:hypothetical protein